MEEALSMEYQLGHKKGWNLKINYFYMTELQ